MVPASGEPFGEFDAGDGSGQVVALDVVAVDPGEVVEGALVLDAFGGSLSMLENSDKPELRKCSGFTYVWEHARFHPVKGTGLVRESPSLDQR